MKNTKRAQQREVSELGTQLKTLRLEKGLTQEEVANALEIAKSSWAMYERGERTPRDEIKAKIARFFGVGIETLFFNQFEH